MDSVEGCFFFRVGCDYIRDFRFSKRDSNKLEMWTDAAFLSSRADLHGGDLYELLYH